MTTWRIRKMKEKKRRNKSCKKERKKESEKNVKRVSKKKKSKSKVWKERNSQKKNKGVKDKRNVQKEIEGINLKMWNGWSNSRNQEMARKKESRIVINVENSRNRMKSKLSKTKTKRIEFRKSKKIINRYIR